MKHFLRAIVVAMAVGWACPAIGAETLAAANLRQNLFSSCFLSEKEGWLVGDLGRVFHTVDGAKTWERQDAGSKVPFMGIACAEGGPLWAAGQSGQIAQSKDKGKTWQMQASGSKRELLGIAFANAQRGIVVGDFGTMLRTDDGGATWNQIPLPQDIKLPVEVAETVDPGDVVLYGAAFADPEHVWIAGEFGVILASSDGGLTWQSQTSTVEETLFGIFFADQQRGWATGIDATLLATTDGGISWHKQEVETPRGFSLALYDVAVRGSYGWAVGNNGFLLNSKDAGATWHLAKVPVQMASSWLRQVSLLPDGRGFIVGATGLVLATDRDTFTPLKERF